MFGGKGAGSLVVDRRPWPSRDPTLTWIFH